MADTNEAPATFAPANNLREPWPKECDRCYVLVEPRPSEEPKVVTVTTEPKVCPTGTVENHSSETIAVEIDKTYFLKKLTIEVQSSPDLGQQQFSIPLIVPRSLGTSYLIQAPWMIIWYDVVERDDRKVVWVRLENWSHTNSRRFWFAYSYVVGRYEKLP